MGNADDHALAAAKHIFERFNWLVSTGMGLSQFRKSFAPRNGNLTLALFYTSKILAPYDKGLKKRKATSSIFSHSL